ncbi:3-ketoacyl-CoA reductase 1 isoform 1 [Hibiscus syriacus]|uniref:3-ketoacyl-CoA reductase 1 isoform 1 n=1 Tax=Hibiscus syriacus TaxID=106335 RepID=A0A6A3C8V7_HIBSY|nr:uncharacterized protein LOC120202958 [Hibiscus syriacus]KAE8725226.1 3-ketoacyl-CoA reductase 1 isoform 1 [Hibiscus syriacus]
MEKPDSASGCGCADVYNTVFIDTSLDTHLAMIVSDSDTVSDLKKKIMYEHPLCFPNIGEIKIHALKVKRRGYLYHLSDSMFLKSAFGGVIKNWFLSVDASIVEEHRENHNYIEYDTNNVVTCFGTGINNSSADVVDILPGDMAIRLANANDASLPQDQDDCCAKQNSASQQFGFSNSIKENSEGLHKEAEHTSDSDSQVSFPATNKGSMPMVHSKDVGEDKIYEDLPVSVATKLKTKKRKKDAIHHDLKENGALVVRSVKDASDSGNVLKENSFQNDGMLGNQLQVDETVGSLSSDGNKMLVTRKRTGDEGTKVSGEQSELETKEHKDVSHNDREYESKENTLQTGPASKKKRKAGRKDGNEISLIEHGEKSTGSDTAISECTLGQKLGNTSSVFDHLNTESLKQNRLSTADASGGSKKRKRQRLNPGLAGNEVSSAKDVNVAKDKDSVGKTDPDSFLGKRSMGGVISEPCLFSPSERQDVSETNKVAHTGGDSDMDETNDCNSESKKNEAPEPDVASVIKTRDLYDQNSNHVDGHFTPLFREGINFQKAFGVSGDENQIGTLEEKIVEPKKSSRKVKKSKKNKGPVGVTEAVDAVHNSVPASGISPVECPTIVTDEHLCDNDEQACKTDGKEESEMEKPDCSPSVTDVKADDVIQDVLESLKRCNNTPENAENTDKKLRKKTKNKSSTVMAPPELPGKGYVDHRDPTFLAHNVTELNASSKSTRKTVNGDSVQLNGTNLGSNQITLERKHDGRSIQDVSVDHTKSTRVEKSNNNKEVPRGSETAKSQQHCETVDSGEIIIDKAAQNTGVETAVKGKRRKNSKPELRPSEILNVDQDKEVKMPAAKASSIQSQRLSSKVEPSSSNFKSSKPLLIIPEIAVKGPPQSKKSEKFNSTPNNAQRPIDVNSSTVHTELKKNDPRAVSSSAFETPKKTINSKKGAFETPKKTINSKKGGSEPQSHLDIAKATGTNSRKVANILANKKSLLATTGTIFRHDDKESSDDEDGVGNSDSSTRNPSDSSSSSEYSSNSIAKGSSPQNGSYDSEVEEAGGRKKQNPGSSSPKSMSLHAILRNSSSYKKAKLTASQDIDSQPEEFVLDSQAAT